MKVVDHVQKAITVMLPIRVKVKLHALKENTMTKNPNGAKNNVLSALLAYTVVKRAFLLMEPDLALVDFFVFLELMFPTPTTKQTWVKEVSALLATSVLQDHE